MYIYTFLEDLQGWWLNHFPGQQQLANVINPTLQQFQDISLKKKKKSKLKARPKAPLIVLQMSPILPYLDTPFKNTRKAMFYENI